MVLLKWQLCLLGQLIKTCQEKRPSLFVYSYKFDETGDAHAEPYAKFASQMRLFEFVSQMGVVECASQMKLLISLRRWVE